MIAIDDQAHAHQLRGDRNQPEPRIAKDDDDRIAGITTFRTRDVPIVREECDLFQLGDFRFLAVPLTDDRSVTAGIDDEINSSLNKEGFTPQRSNLLSNAEKPSVEKTYENKQVCTLRFTLGFRSEGAKLTFSIKSPDGKQFTKEAESTMGLEVKNAAKGTWTYTVTADRASANFPFTVTVGEKK